MCPGPCQGRVPSYCTRVLTREFFWLRSLGLAVLAAGTQGRSGVLRELRTAHPECEWPAVCDCPYCLSPTPWRQCDRDVRV